MLVEVLLHWGRIEPALFLARLARPQQLIEPLDPERQSGLHLVFALQHVQNLVHAVAFLFKLPLDSTPLLLDAAQSQDKAVGYKVIEWKGRRCGRRRTQSGRDRTEMHHELEIQALL
jgi:hypothetical protein